MSKANRGRITPKAVKHPPFKPIQTYDVATVFGLIEEFGGIESVAEEYDVPTDSVRGWAVHGNIPTGWHLRMFGRLCAVGKTVDPTVFGFREDSDVARALGSGLDCARTSNWTIKGEALYAQLDTPTASWVSPGSGTFPANAVYNERFNTSVAIIRAGLNYKFN
jgi:opacity protein-like surface antigen